MEKITHNFVQGSAEWLAFRASKYNASEASAMLGISKYQTRTELLQMKATGISPDVSPATQRIFDDGHRLEALARPFAEKIIGEDLFSPTVSAVVDGLPLSASFDGVTMFEDCIWEHKTLNKELAESLSVGQIPNQYKPQIEQQLLIMGAERCLFMASNGTEESAVYAWYESDPQMRSQLIEGWKQFEADLSNFEIANAPSIVVGKAPDELPALRIELTGMVTASNLKVFEDSALAVIDTVKTTLSTDQDFADAKKAVKWCGEVEEAVAAAKKQALSQTQSIDELFSSLDRISAHARETRLKVNKLVQAQELLVKTTIKQKAEIALAEHIAGINRTLGQVALPNVHVDFAGAMKSKRTIASLQDAVDTELARAKIDASQAADSIRINLSSMAELAVDHAFLFSDIQQLVTKANDDLVTLIKFRISEHQKAEQAKADAKRIAEEQQAQRLAAIKPESVVEKVAAPEPVRATPVQAAAPVAQATEPVTSNVVEQVAMQASVTDFEALIKAVAYGQAPITLLLVNWEALDAMVAAQGSNFSMAGVTLGKAAA